MKTRVIKISGTKDKMFEKKNDTIAKYNKKPIIILFLINRISSLNIKSIENQGL